jgi:hypothetical protein
MDIRSQLHGQAALSPEKEQHAPNEQDVRWDPATVHVDVAVKGWYVPLAANLHPVPRWRRHVIWFHGDRRSGVRAPVGEEILSLPKLSIPPPGLTPGTGIPSWGVRRVPRLRMSRATYDLPPTICLRNYLTFYAFMVWCWIDTDNFNFKNKCWW